MRPNGSTVCTSLYKLSCIFFFFIQRIIYILDGGYRFCKPIPGMIIITTPKSKAAHSAPLNCVNHILVIYIYSLKICSFKMRRDVMLPRNKSANIVLLCESIYNLLLRDICFVTVERTSISKEHIEWKNIRLWDKYSSVRFEFGDIAYYCILCGLAILLRDVRKNCSRERLWFVFAYDPHRDYIVYIPWNTRPAVFFIINGKETWRRKKNTQIVQHYCKCILHAKQSAQQQSSRCFCARCDAQIRLSGAQTISQVSRGLFARRTISGGLAFPHKTYCHRVSLPSYSYVYVNWAVSLEFSRANHACNAHAWIMRLVCIYT